LRPLGDRRIVTGPLVYTATYPTSEKHKLLAGGAGLVSTAADYTSFCKLFLDGGERDGKRLLKADTVKKMTTNRITGIPGAVFGYGFGIIPTDQKGGFGGGTFLGGGFFATMVWVDPKNELTGVLMTQLHPGTPGMTLNQDFIRAVYAGLEK
jgi:CubicO group peptidase (beta-lactamase class C family)